MDHRIRKQCGAKGNLFTENAFFSCRSEVKIGVGRSLGALAAMAGGSKEVVSLHNQANCALDSSGNVHRYIYKAH